MRYAVGDKVRITQDEEALRSHFVGNVEKVAGAIGEVTGTDSKGAWVAVDGVCADWHYLWDTLKKVDESSELSAYRKRVVDVARLAKVYVDNEESWCKDGFEKALNDLGILDDVYPCSPEPPVGSIVRSKSQSIAYVRVWQQVRDGERSWGKTGTSERYTWNEIKDHVVIVLDTEGASYVND